MKLTTNQLFLIWVSLAAVIAVADCVSTWIALGIGLHEQNPVVLMLGTGPGLLIIKLCIVAVAVLLGMQCEKSLPGTKYYPALAFSLVTGPVVLNNILWITGVF